MSDKTVTFSKWVTLGLLLKASIAPMHFWGAPIVILLPKIIGFIFLTWQKIAPLMLLITVTPKFTLWRILLVNGLVATLCGIGSKSLLILLFFSGLSHMAWVLSSPINIASTYFIIYAIVSAPLFFSSQNLPLLLMNLAGLPPLTGFFMKLRVLQTTRAMIRVFLLFISVLILFAYARIYLFYTIKMGRIKIITMLVCILGIVYCYHSIPRSSFKWESIYYTMLPTRLEFLRITFCGKVGCSNTPFI